MEVPDRFVELTSQDIARKFPPQRPPQAAFGNDHEHMTVTIAVTLSKTRVQPGKLEQFGRFLQSALSAQGQVESNGIVTLAGREWYRIVLRTQALDQPVRNEFLATPMADQVIMVNLNSTVADYPTYQKALETVRQTLRCK